MAISSQDIQAQASIAPDVALAYAREHGVEKWFYDHVLHKRTLQDRIEAKAPLKERELDRFDWLTLLVERAIETFQNEVAFTCACSS